jgi:hypothetical protein
MFEYVAGAVDFAPGTHPMLHCLPVRGGQAEGKSASRAGLAFCPDPAAVRFHDAAGDREPQTDSRPVAAPCLPEALEQLRKLVLRDSAPGVADGKHHLVSTRVRGEPHVPEQAMLSSVRTRAIGRWIECCWTTCGQRRVETGLVVSTR